MACGVFGIFQAKGTYKDATENTFDISLHLSSGFNVDTVETKFVC